ncbi:hypothetical protein MANES_04G036500v8 [Manihot esculenta]|uniref:Uncharacterized protein n=1 Tax=Manihot esculenta TaxID=3983 RepID=A0ACB7HTW5_MANES|nr:hypothetical protein MANES_04G036500v8 [Manihot esculenta]
MKFVLSICFIAATILSILPCEYRDGNRIPSTIIFRQLPSIIFHAFALLLVLAFTGSFIALMIEDDTQIVRQICWYISVTSMAAPSWLGFPEFPFLGSFRCNTLQIFETWNEISPWRILMEKILTQ